ncbi:hypothetical protein PPROV_000937900 [Pycnococcus provasolii]|uniref:Uncharacterized protein n=1 Tax=Pycnococcus provasolii TaxID=41880 RepID=A0A830HUL5_9CHLO|nr:hypothetical protein PPROV_000937900 [Pycnococcus provasolii]
MFGQVRDRAFNVRVTYRRIGCQAQDQQVKHTNVDENLAHVRDFASASVAAIASPSPTRRPEMTGASARITASPDGSRRILANDDAMSVVAAHPHVWIKKLLNKRFERAGSHKPTTASHVPWSAHARCIKMYAAAMTSAALS